MRFFPGRADSTTNGMMRQAGGRAVGRVISITSIVRPLFTQAVGLDMISPVLYLNRWKGTLVRETESNNYYSKRYLSVESWLDGVM